MELVENSEEKKSKVIDFRDLPNDVIVYITRNHYLFEVEFMENEKPNLVKTFYGKIRYNAFIEGLVKTSSIYQIFGMFQVYVPSQFPLLPRKARGIMFCKKNAQIPRNLIRNTFLNLEFLGKFSIVDEGDEKVLEELDPARFERLDVRILSFDDDLLRSMNHLRSIRVMELEVKSMPIKDPTIDLLLPNLRKLSVMKFSMYKKNFRILSPSISFKNTISLRHIDLRYSHVCEDQISNICSLGFLVELLLVGCELGENYFQLFQIRSLRNILVDSCRFNLDSLSKVELKENNSLNKVSMQHIQEDPSNPSVFPVSFVGELMKKTGDQLALMEFNDFRLGSGFLEYILENYKDGRRFTLNVLNNPDISIDVCELVNTKRIVGLRLIHS